MFETITLLVSGIVIGSFATLLIVTWRGDKDGSSRHNLDEVDRLRNLFDGRS